MLGLSLGIPFRPYDRSAIQQMLDALRRNNGSLWYAPDNALGDGQPNLLTAPEFAAGLTDAPLRGGLVSLASLAGYDNAIAFGHDGSTNGYAYKNFAATAGVAYTVSVIVKMDDGLAPTFGNGDSPHASNTFALVHTDGISPTTYTVVPLPDGTYRVSGTLTRASATSNHGVIKYSTNNNRTFKVTGYKLEQGSVATAYTPQSVLRQRGVYVDNAGTTPVTAVADLIGLITDKSYGGQLGPELWTSPSALGATVSVTAGVGTFTATTPSEGTFTSASGVVSGKTYQATMSIADISGVGASFSFCVGGLNGAGQGQIYGANGTFSQIFVASASGAIGVRPRNSVSSGAVSNVTIRELTGNHATQSAVASKPSFQRVPKRLGPNLVVNGTFDTDTAWTKGAGWTISGGTAVLTANTGVLSQVTSMVVGKTYKLVLATTINYQLRVGGASVGYFDGSASVPPFVATGGLLEIVPNGAQSGTVDNIEVREVLEWANVISFDGYNDFLQTGITTGNEGWVCAGVTPGVITSYRSLLHSGVLGSVKGVWLLSDLGRWVFSVNNGSATHSTSYITATTSSVVVSGGWNDSSVLLDVDGASSAVARSGNCVGTTPLRIGMTGADSFPFAGSMHAFAYTPVLPSAADRKTIRNGIAALQGRTL